MRQWTCTLLWEILVRGLREGTCVLVAFDRTLASRAESQLPGELLHVAVISLWQSMFKNFSLVMFKE